MKRASVKKEESRNLDHSFFSFLNSRICFYADFLLQIRNVASFGVPIEEMQLHI